MRKYLILAESKEEVSSIEILLQLYDPSSKRHKPDTVVFPRTGLNSTGAASLVFETLEPSIKEALIWFPDVDCRLTVIVSQIDLSRLNPLGEGTPFESAIAMLILAFPEVHWVFGNMWSRASVAEVVSAEGQPSPPNALLQESGHLEKPENPYQSADFSHSISRWHSLASLLRPPFEPLFDLSGLREHVKQKARDSKQDKGKQLAWFMPERKHLASSLDDELNYAYFNSYVAYRFGFRAIPITRLRLAEELLKESERIPPDFRLSLEDLYPSMPDAENHEHLSDLVGVSNEPDGSPGRSRPIVLSGLYLVNPSQPNSPRGYLPHEDSQRILVTSDQQTPDKDVAKANEEFLRTTGIRRVKKPFPGMFAFRRAIVTPPNCTPPHRPRVHRKIVRWLFWEERNGAMGWLMRWLDKKFMKPRDYYEEGFSWPPHVQATDQRRGHSAPGRLNLIATTLIRRASVLWQSGVSSAPEGCRGAILAGLAVELYGAQVATASVDALILKHQFEVAAECQFSGIGYYIEVQPRLAEVREELQSVFSRHGRFLRSRHVDNSEMLLVNDMTRVFTEHAQFDEEHALRRRLLRLYNRLRWSHYIWPLNWRIIFLPIRIFVDTYLEWASSSLVTLSLGSIFWVVVFTLAFWKGTAIEHFISPFGLHVPLSVVHALEVSTGVEVGEMATTAGAASPPPTVWLVMMGTFGAVLGLTHFGLLVSILYTRLIRK